MKTMERLTYPELCKELGLKPARGGYRQRQLKKIKEIWCLHEYDTTPKTYMITKEKQIAPTQFNVPPELKHSGGRYMICCAGCKTIYGETADYYRRYKEIERDERCKGHEILLFGGVFKNIR